jgi:hypothetical protein
MTLRLPRTTQRRLPRATRRLVGAATVAVLIGGIAFGAGSVNGAFSGVTTNPGNSWSTWQPAVVLASSAFNGPFPETATGTLAHFVANETVIYRLDGATPLTGSPSAVGAGGAATITSLSMPSASEGAHTLYVIGGNGSQATTAVTIDATIPTASASLSPAANGNGWNNTSPVQVTLIGSDPGGSGIAQIRYTLDGTDPTVSGTAVTYGSPFTVASTTTVKYYATDAAGNVSVVGTKQVNIDTTGPANSIAVSNVTGNAVKSSNTVYYRGANAGSFTLTNTVTDATSGPASSATAALGGAATGWTHTPSMVTTPAGGPYVSSTFTWGAATSSAPTETVTGADAASNTTGTVLSFVNDSTGPTGGSVDATGLVGAGSRYSTSTNLSIAFADGTDTVGVTSGKILARATATLTNGSCGAYGAYTNLATDPSSPYPNTVADQACYSYRYTVLDLLGNSTGYYSGDVKVDTTAPAAPSLGYSVMTNTYQAGGTVWYRSTATSGAFTTTAATTDTASGIASYAFPALGTGWTSTPGTTDVNAYSWAATGMAAPGSKSVTATNNATGTSAGTSFTMTADDTAPIGGSVTNTNGYHTTTSLNVTTGTGTDGGSNIDTNSRQLQRRVGTLSAGSCSAWGAYANLAANPTSPYADTVAGASCYQYQYLVDDNVDNRATYTGTDVTRVDTTAPSGDSISYTDGAYASASLSVTFTAGADAESGINTGVGKIQRATGTLSAGACSAWTGFSDLVTNPTSPYSATVADATCYQFRYVTTNNAGLTSTATNANITQVSLCATFTLQATADSYVWGNSGTADMNFGTATTMSVGNSSASFRALVRFDYPAYPAGCTLNTVVLEMVPTSGGTGRNHTAKRITAAWTEAAVTYNNQPATTTTGQTTVASVATNAVESWDVKTMFLADTNSAGTGTERGFMIIDAAETNGIFKAFASSEHATTGYRPRLVIDFN